MGVTTRVQGGFSAWANPNRLNRKTREPFLGVVLGLGIIVGDYLWDNRAICLEMSTAIAVPWKVKTHLKITLARIKVRAREQILNSVVQRVLISRPNSLRNRAVLHLYLDSNSSKIAPLIYLVILHNLNHNLNLKICLVVNSNRRLCLVVSLRTKT